MINRRALLKKLVFGLIGLNFLSRRTSAQEVSGDERELNFQWRVPQAHLETVKNELRFNGEIKEEQGTKGGWIFVFIGVVLIPYLAKAVLALRREIIHGGIVIDTRGDKINIDTDKSLPGGVIVMVSKESTEIFERNEISDPTELVSALMKGL